jgi:GAF domain-containing protein/DNA-binding response OmpR family regulator
MSLFLAMWLGGWRQFYVLTTFYFLSFAAFLVTDPLRRWTGNFMSLRPATICQHKPIFVRKHTQLYQPVFPCIRKAKAAIHLVDYAENYLSPLNSNSPEFTRTTREKSRLPQDNNPFTQESSPLWGKFGMINQFIQAFNNSTPFIDLQSACRAVLEQPFLKELFEFDFAQICLWDEDAKKLRILLYWPEDTPMDNRITQIEQGYTGWVAANHSSLRITDTQQPIEIKVEPAGFPYRSYLAVPLKIGSRLLGTLELAAASANIYQPEDITLLEIIAHQVALGMENARLFSLTNQELQQRVDELAGLQRVSSELNSTLDLDKILNRVLEEAMRVTQADFGHVYFYNAAAETLVAYRDQGWRENVAAPYPPTISAKTTPIERAFRTGEAVLIPDVSSDEQFSILKNEARSRVVAPVYYAGEPIGIIDLESCQLNFFNSSQLRYLKALANHAAVAIGNAQAYQQQKLEREQANRRADQLARLSEISNDFRTNRPVLDVLEDIAYAIAESVGYDVVLISLVADNPPKIYPKVGAGIPIVQLEELQQPAQARPLANLQAVTQEKFRLSSSYFIPAERQAIWQDKLNIPYGEKSRLVPHPPVQLDSIPISTVPGKNLWQTGDLLLTPLVGLNNNLLGLLTVANPVNEQRPDLASIQALETFANHAAAAIENAQLFELEQQRRRLADTLRGVAETISSHIEIDELLNIVLQELKKVVDYDKATVELLENKSLVIIGGQGWEEYSRQMIGLSFSMEGNNPSRLVLETQEPLIVKNAQVEYAGIFSAPPYNRIKSWLGVPLTYGANVLGLMSVSSGQIDFFSREDLDVVLAFANQVAVALQNARLFNEARQQVRQLAALTEVAQSLNRALELNQVLNLVLDAVFDLVGHRNGSIWLIDRTNNTVKIANTYNIPGFLVEEFNRSDTSIQAEPFASVIQSGRILMIKGDENKERLANYILPLPDDVTYVPLKTEEGVLGILAIETVIQSRTMLELVTTLADLAAVAIEGARLLEDTRRRAAEMQQLYRLGVEVGGLLEVQQVMRLVINNALALLNSQVSVILFWDEQTEQYLFEAAAVSETLNIKLGLTQADHLNAHLAEQVRLSLWIKVVERIIHTGQPVTLNFAARQSGLGKTSETLVIQGELAQLKLHLGIQSLLGVPILVQNQIAGAIFVGMLTPYNFESREVQLLSFVANQTAVAIRNAQLVQRLNLLTEGLEQRVTQRTEELAQTLKDLTEERDRVEILYQITRELSSSFDLDKVLNYALGLLNRAIGISLGSILLLDHETGYLTYRAALGRDISLPRDGIQTGYKVGYGLAGRAMELREPRLIPDLTLEPDWIPTSETDDRRSAIVVPLNTGNDVLGALLLFHPEPHYFTEAQLKLVTAAGAQIATAVNNAELYLLITEQTNRLRFMFQQQAAEAAKNEAILKGITDGVLVLDANRRLVLVNPKAAEILNINAVDVQNQPLIEILGRSESPVELELTKLLYEHLSKALLEIEAGQPSVEFRVEFGPKTVMVALAPVALSESDPPSIVAVLRDISQEAEIERLKNEFISTVSHELRTPMTSIKGYTDLLLSGNPKIGDLNPTQQRFVKVIQSNSNRLTNLVNDILEISRIETGRIKLEFTSINIVELIKEVAVSFEGQMVKKAMNLSLKLPDHLPDVYADRARLIQVLVNLIGNAWQYTPEGGNINIYANVVGGFVQVDVEDTGIGIVEKDIEFIFDRFFRSERTEVQVVDGTGLGLSITSSFVEMMGGRIWVKSVLDVGSTFSFTIPLDLSQDQAAIGQTISARNSQLLVIDHNQEIINLLKLDLQSLGYPIITLNQGKEALEFIRNAGGGVKLIILEALLEDRDSLALVEELRRDEALANIPVFLSSFYIDQARKELSSQIVGYISRNFSQAQILESVNLALGKAKIVSSELSSSANNSLDHILIVEKDRAISKWLKDILMTNSHEVQCAFNGQQALDMASVYPPLLAFISVNMFIAGKSVISQFRDAPDLANIPVIVLMDRPIPFLSGQAETVKILRLPKSAGVNQPTSVKDLISEVL